MGERSQFHCSSFPVETFYAHEPESDYVRASIRTVFTIHQLRNQATSSSSSPVRDQIQKACHRLHSRCLLHREAHPTALEPIVRFLPQAATTYLRCDTSATEAKGISRPQVIVATNITEKSLTVGEIVYVIDPAFSKLSMTHELASNRP